MLVRLALLPREVELIAYCRGPWCGLAFEAIALLRHRGRATRRLDGGLPEWRRAGLEIATGAALCLAVAQALFQTASVLIMTIGGLAGQVLAPDTALATLPIACVALGTAIATIPASLLMGGIGRRPGFVLGGLLGATGGGLAVWSMFVGSFPVSVR